MNGSNFSNSGSFRIPSSFLGSLEQDATPDLLKLLSDAQDLAQKHGQGLNIAHVLVTAFKDVLPEPLGGVIPSDARQAFYVTISVYTANVGRAPDLTASLDYARRLARGRRMSAALVIYAIAVTDSTTQGWLIAHYKQSQGSADGLMDRLRKAAEESLTTRSDDSAPMKVISMEPSQLRAAVQRVLPMLKLRAEKPYAFAHAFSPVLRNIATEVAMRPVRTVRIPLVRGPKGSGIERFAQAVAEAPEAGLPFSWPFKDAYCLSVASVLARKDARDFLEMVVQEIGPTSVLVLIEAREFDRDQEHAERALECLDYLASQVPTPTNVILVYPTDDTGNLVGTRLRRATFQDYTIEALLKTQTQQFVREYFWKYWEEVDKVSVAADAFDDVYPVSAFIFEDDMHFNLPFLPIVLGSNAARTVKGGREAIIALVEAAQHRLEGARSAIRPNKSLTDAFARYFVTLQAELDALRANPEPQARNGLLLVTRELVSAELAASAVYVFQWPDIEKMGRLAAITPEPYPRT